MVRRARIGNGVRFQPSLSREVCEGRGLNTGRWWLVCKGLRGAQDVGYVVCCGVSGVFPYIKTVL